MLKTIVISICLCVAGVFLSCNSSRHNVPQVAQGVISAMDWDFARDGDIPLDGSWEFYWNKLYQPADFRSNPRLPKTGFINVPDMWTGKIFSGQEIPAVGCATYRTIIIGKLNGQQLGVDIPYQFTSYRLWIDGKFVVSNGVVSNKPEEMQPQIVPELRQFIPASDTVEIVMQIANSYHYRAGFRNSIRIGSFKSMIDKDISLIFTLSLYFGILVILFLYYIWMYVLRKSEVPALWFGLSSAAVALRVGFTETSLLYRVFQGIPTSAMIRAEYIDLSVIGCFLLIYFNSIFKSAIQPFIVRLTSIITVLEVIFICILPPLIYTQSLFIILILFNLKVGCAFFTVTYAVIKRKPHSLIFFLPFLAMLITSVNDWLFALGLLPDSSYYSQYTFIFFVITQAYILSYRLAVAYSSVEALSVSLEQKVIERTRELEIKTNEMMLEKRKADDLLNNILPEETAKELKETGKANPKTYGMVTVLFTDFKDFSKVSELISPELLVAEIDACYSAFDAIIEKYNIEKIKTVGDAYIAAAGLPVSTYTHAIDAVSAALDIIEYMKNRSKEKAARGEVTFEIRIGIHTGPVVAGIVGKKKFAYDIWGDTVNLAARMEQNSEAGKVNISGATWNLAKHKFTCEYRGRIEAKNKGEVDMYFVE